jgi:hypothetical protein
MYRSLPAEMEVCILEAGNELLEGANLRRQSQPIEPSPDLVVHKFFLKPDFKSKKKVKREINRYGSCKMKQTG